MKKSSKRRWKSLTLKIQHLQLELEEREDILKQYESEFFQILSSLEVVSHSENDRLHKETTVINEFHQKDIEPIVEAPPPVDGSDDMKQLWRSIAIITHPDKTCGDEQKEVFYKRANEAWRNGDYSELYKIAVSLDIEVPDTEVTYFTLNEISLDLEKKISEKEKSVLWEWGQAQGEKKQRILDMYLASKGKKRKD